MPLVTARVAAGAAAQAEAQGVLEVLEVLAAEVGAAACGGHIFPVALQESGRHDTLRAAAALEAVAAVGRQRS